MSDQDGKQWTTLDKDLNRISQLEHATLYIGRPMVGLGVALAFIIVAGLGAAVVFGGQPGSALVIAAAALGAYMAINIGANDVANNMGPAVGANALTMGGAIVIAALCESAGALLAGAMWSRRSQRESSTHPPWQTPRCSSGRCSRRFCPRPFGSIWPHGSARRSPPPMPLSAVSWARASRRLALPRSTGPRWG